MNNLNKRVMGKMELNFPINQPGSVPLQLYTAHASLALHSGNRPQLHIQICSNTFVGQIHWLHRLYIYIQSRNWATYYRVRCRCCHIIHPPMYKVPHWSIKGEQTLHIIFQEFFPFPVTIVSRLYYMTWQPNFYLSSRKKQKEYGRFFLYAPKKE
jgi:hypothetical protein